MSSTFHAFWPFSYDFHSACPWRLPLQREDMRARNLRILSYFLLFMLHKNNNGITSCRISTITNWTQETSDKQLLNYIANDGKWQSMKDPLLSLPRSHARMGDISFTYPGENLFYMNRGQGNYTRHIRSSGQGKSQHAWQVWPLKPSVEPALS